METQLEWKILNSSILEGTYLVLGADGNLGPHWVQSIILNGGHVIALGLKSGSDTRLQSIAKVYPGHLKIYDYDLNTSDPFFLKSEIDSVLAGVVLNAGVDALPGAGHAQIEDFSVYEWETTFKVNLFGNVGFLNFILKNFQLDEASVVFIGSMYSQVSPQINLYSHFNQGFGSIKNPAYSASKAALAGVVRQYGTHLASRGIRVNMLSPGGVIGNQDETFVEKFKEKTPTTRMINPESLGSHLVYLLSPMSSCLIGQNIIVDDGYTVW